MTLLLELVEDPSVLELDPAGGRWRFTPHAARAHFFTGRRQHVTTFAAGPVQTWTEEKPHERSVCGLIHRPDGELFDLPPGTEGQCERCLKILEARRRTRASWIIIDAEQVLCRACSSRQLLEMAEGYELSALLMRLRGFITAHRGCLKPLEIVKRPAPATSAIAQTALDIAGGAGDSPRS